MHYRYKLLFNANTAGGSAKCLSGVNAAREAAGLENFAEATNDKKLSAPSDDLENDTEWKKVCEHLIPVSGAEYS